VRRVPNMADTTNGAGDSSQDAALTGKIIRQMEYYFGDHNLMKDRFLQEKIKEDDGWVTLEVMLKFNRLKQLSEDEKVICNAVKESKSGLLEVHEDGTKVRRSENKPLPDDSKERRDEISGRTVYAKVFPTDSSLDELTEFFESYGPVENVFMKRDFKGIKGFKGSVLVTFFKKEDSEKFIKEENTKYKDTPLEEKLTKMDYFNKKKDRKGPAKKSDEAKSNGDSKSEDKKEDDEPEETDEEKAKRQLTQNALIHFKGLNPETSLEKIKNYFSDYSEVGWVDLDRGATEGYLRLKNPNSAAPCLETAKEKNDGKISIDDSELETRVVEGEEELKYWTKMFKEIRENSQNRRGGRFGGRGRGRGGGRGGRGGRGGNRGGHRGKRRSGGGGDGEPAAKAAKVE